MSASYNMEASFHPNGQHLLDLIQDKTYAAVTDSFILVCLHRDKAF